MIFRNPQGIRNLAGSNPQNSIPRKVETRLLNMSEQEQLQRLRRRQSQLEEITVEILLKQERTEQRLAELEQRVNCTDTLLRQVRDVLREKLSLFKDCDTEQQEVELVKTTLQLILKQYDSLPG